MADIMKQYKAVKSLLGKKGDLRLSNEDALRYQDVLQLLQMRGYILDLEVNGANLYRQMADWDGFEDWLKGEIKESKRMGRREWRIAIISAVIGAAVGLIPYIVSLFASVN